MRTQAVLSVVLAGILFALAHVAFASELTGKVVGVSDGDTLEILTGAKELYRVRVSGIDAPEKAQPFGQASKRTMSDLSFGRDVRVIWSKRDRYGRIVGKVREQHIDVGLAMVQAGMAWHFKRYVTEQEPEDRRNYAYAELEARTARRGLWSDSKPVPPWDFRREGRASMGTGPSAFDMEPYAGLASECPCRGPILCVGPKGGRYCFTANGTKQYQR